MKKLLPVMGVAILFVGLGMAAQAQNPVANLEITNPNNVSVTVVDPANNSVTPTSGLGLESNSKVTWLGGDPVKVVFPGQCYIQLPTFQGITPAATPCCAGTLTQLTSLTVDANACALPGAVPLIATGGIAGAAPYILLGAAVVGGAAAIIANSNDDEEAPPPTGGVSPSPSSF